MVKEFAPVMKSCCATCPFREGSKYAGLREGLTLSALTEASRICHCTGTNAIGGRTGKPDRICRGARDAQLKMFVAMGYLSEPTDEAWTAKLKEINSDNRRKRHESKMPRLRR
jgi:hypothetical protein